MNRILLIGLCSVLLISLFAFVAAQSMWDSALSNGGSFFKGIFGMVGDASEKVVAQWLLFFLVVLIIYAVSSAIPFLGENRHYTIRWLVSIIIGILAIFFLKGEEILTILQTYKTLGVALTVIVPFFVIAVVSKDLQDKQHGILSKFIWILFLGTLIVRYATVDVAEIGDFGKWAFWVTAIGSLIMIIWEGRVYFFLFKQEIRNARETAGAEALAGVTSKLEVIREEIEHAPNEAAAKASIAKYDRLVKRQNELGGNYRSWGSTI